MCILFYLFIPGGCKCFRSLWRSRCLPADDGDDEVDETISTNIPAYICYWLFSWKVLSSFCLIFQSTEVATVAFGCPWLTLSTKSKRNLIVFIARAQKPLLITAYNLVPITLPTFTRVIINYFELTYRYRHFTTWWFGNLLVFKVG